MKIFFHMCISPRMRWCDIYAAATVPRTRKSPASISLYMSLLMYRLRACHVFQRFIGTRLTAPSRAGCPEKIQEVKKCQRHCRLICADKRWGMLKTRSCLLPSLVLIMKALKNRECFIFCPLTFQEVGRLIMSSH